jgi:choline dehydrogenase
MSDTRSPTCPPTYPISSSSVAALLRNGRALADAGRSVVLLEAGRSDATLRLRIPALSYSVVSNAGYDWGYFPASPTQRRGRADKWPAGRRLGGGSAVNGMICARPHLGLRQLGGTRGDRQSAADVWPYFRRMETFEDGGNAYRGDAGPIRVGRNRMHYPIVDATERGGGRQRHRAQPGPQRRAERRGHRITRRRRSIAACAAARRKATCATGAVRGDRWCGPGHRAPPAHRRRSRHRSVDGERRAHAARAQRRRAAAGSLNSPRLLMLSGVGPKADLERLGITVRADLGRRCQHRARRHALILRVYADHQQRRARPRGARAGLRLPRAATRAVAPRCHAQAFVRTSEAEPIPDVQVSLTAFAFRINEIGRAELLKVPPVSITVCLARPKGRGRLSLRSADPFAPPASSTSCSAAPAIWSGSGAA